MPIRIGSVPYLNAKPLVDWFHSPECRADVEIVYAPPSQLAVMLRENRLDVANVSIFEGLRNSGLVLLPNMSISATGAVKSVRLFSKTPMERIRTVALDTSSLTSVALTRILLKEVFGLSPVYENHPPQLDAMLASHDAGLIIGDLKLFDLLPGTTVYDLGKGWFERTKLPFVYAAWLAREDAVSPEMIGLLNEAKQWGVARLEALAEKWSERMALPLDRCLDYFLNVMDYDLSPDQMEGLFCFQRKCVEHGLIPSLLPLRVRS